MSSTASDSGALKLVESIFRHDRTPEGFAAMQRVFDACTGRTFTELNMPTRVEPMTAPRLGDRSAAYLVISTEPANATAPEHTTRGPTLVVLVDDMLMVLHAIDVQQTGSTPRLSDAEFFEIAARAVDKLGTRG